MTGGGSPDPKKRALGRGLDALLPTPQATANKAERSVFSCALEKITPQKGQPRQHFDGEQLDELAQSIREHGLLEPIIVRRTGAGADTFEIIAGERRWRACQKAGLREALVVVKDVAPAAAFELALIENVQRADLNPVELAEALDRLVKEHGYTQESLATRLGKDRTTVANSLRLLKLPARVRTKIISGELSEGHGRALLGAGEDAKIDDLAEKVLRGRLNVRATEALVRTARERAAARKLGGSGKEPDDRDERKGQERGGTKEAQEKSAAVRDLEQRLTRSLGTKVEVRDQGNKGEIAIAYADLDVLDAILDRFLS